MSLSKEQLGDLFSWPEDWDKKELDLTLDAGSLEKLDNNVIISLYKYFDKDYSIFSKLFYRMIPVPAGLVVLSAKYFRKKILAHQKKVIKLKRMV